MKWTQKYRVNSILDPGYFSYSFESIQRCVDECCVGFDATVFATWPMEKIVCGVYKGNVSQEDLDREFVE